MITRRTEKDTLLFPAPGTIVHDVRRKRVGIVMGHVGPYVQLRPEGGGREWDARPEDVRPPASVPPVPVAHHSTGDMTGGCHG
ncbi:hypothetical protein [Streptomyces sp. ST2-7A]|uniref:hypothetical protein n=1 Tax=Streptomyces sp. ST2-7A TaxID=2907214 RepID=UPI001F2B4B3D|nr:hypothetical protein [Streptomyces sp. ST2-7A]MCE7081871.1 hypothetical protein [Streptomyces sp. ST2-7A]